MDPIKFSKALDVLGLSKELVDFRIASAKKMELTLFVQDTIGKDVFMMTGSQIEGATIPCLFSDTDIMRINQNKVIINSVTVTVIFY